MEPLQVNMEVLTEVPRADTEAEVEMMTVDAAAEIALAETETSTEAVVELAPVLEVPETHTVHEETTAIVTTTTGRQETIVETAVGPAEVQSERPLLP